MEYRRLGRSSVQVSPLCVGTMCFGNQTDETESIRIVHAAVEAGINFIDTANVYNDGSSETIVGKALAGGRRDKVVLATKCTGRVAPGPNNEGSSRLHVMQQVEASLRRLQTDHIDLYQLHVMDLATPPEESMRTLDDLVRAGKVRYVGVSKWAPAWTVEALMLCERHGWSRIVSEQSPYNLLDRRVENELVWTCLRHGVGIIPWAPLATGILTGQYRRDVAPPATSRAKTGWFPGYRLNPRALEVVEALRPLADEKHVTLAEFSLAWLMQRPGVTAPIVGYRTLAHLTSSLNALEVTFTDDDLARIDAIAPPGSWVSNYYDVSVSRHCRRAAGISEE